MSSPFQRQFSAKSPLNQKPPYPDYFKDKADRAKRLKSEYKDVMNYKGKPLLTTKPWRLLTSNTSNQPYGMGKIMNKVVELGKNLAIPGRLIKKVKKSYDYYKETQKPPY